MKRFLILSAKILAGVAALLIAAAIGVDCWLSTPENRYKIMQYAISALRDRLDTDISIDSLDVNIANGTLDIFRFRISDQQQQTLLGIDTLRLQISPWELLEKKVNIRRAQMEGVDVLIYKDEFGVPNYQFIADSLASKKKDGHKKMDMKIDFDIKHADLTNVHASIDGKVFTLGRLNVKGYKKARIDIEDFRYSWSQMRKRGIQANECYLSRAHISATIGDDTTGTARVIIDSIFFTTCINAPHKRTGKPKRGYFDDGHMRAAAYIELDIPFWSKDSAAVELRHLKAVDHASALNVDSLSLSANINRHRVEARDIHIRLTDSRLSIPQLTLHLPDSTRAMTYSTSMFDGTVILTDIAHPFAPFALQQFSMPLQVNAWIEGDTSTVRFNNVRVYTADNRFSVSAKGSLTGMRRKEDLYVHFDVDRMRAANSKVFEIIHQFPIRKFMMTQLRNLGTIGFRGSLDVRYKREMFRGTLTTAAGPVSVNLDIDDKNKYLSGNVTTKTFDLGKAIAMKALGNIDCAAQFRFDISMPRTALIHRRNNGKLPIGHVHAQVNEAYFQRIAFRNLNATINSDGALAAGHLEAPRKQVDLLADFTFTSTDSISKMKIVPHVNIHALEKLKQKKADKKREKAVRKDSISATVSTDGKPKSKKSIFRRNYSED